LYFEPKTCLCDREIVFVLLNKAEAPEERKVDKRAEVLQAGVRIAMRLHIFLLHNLDGDAIEAALHVVVAIILILNVSSY